MQALVGLVEDLFQVVTDHFNGFRLIHDHWHLMEEDELSLTAIIIERDEVLERVVILNLAIGGSWLIIKHLFIHFFIPVGSTAPPPGSTNSFMVSMAFVQLVTKDLLDGHFNVLVIDAAVGDYFQPLALVLGE